MLLRILKTLQTLSLIFNRLFRFLSILHQTHSNFPFSLKHTVLTLEAFQITLDTFQVTLDTFQK
jgi:hypothetical protein